jgi:hypothetical protein
MQCNPQFPSRPSTVKELLKRKKTQSHQESEAAFDDIGAGTMVDFVHSDQTIQQIVDCMFGEKTESGLKHRADMLLCLGFSSRGDSIRKLRLPNIGLISFADEGVCGAKLLRCVWRKSKRNQFGNIEETALMRHREAQRCSFGALALYFFLVGMLVTNRGQTSPIVRHGIRFTYSKVQTLSPSLRIRSNMLL